MDNKWIRVWSCVVCVAVGAAVLDVRAEDVEKRWRLGFAIGAADSRDSIRSDSANILTITDTNDIPVRFFEDPRNDDAQQLGLQINTRATYALSAQYAANKILIIDFSAAYQTGDVGNVELQAQFDGDPIPVDDRFKFTIFKIPAGDIEMVPVNATALARFRPRASFNPYIGLGFGYTFVGFDPSSQLNTLSRNMDSSIGRFTRLEPFPGTFAPEGPVVDLEGVTIDANDSWNWHVTGGVEYTFKRKWATYLDVSYSFASQNMTLAFNPPSASVGISVPNKRVLETDPEATDRYGAIDVSQGGFIDGGRLVPAPENPGADCDTDPLLCTFVFDPDGVPDAGVYYVKSGSLKYDDIVLLIGIRYTF